MPVLQVANTDLFYVDVGTGDEVVLFASALLFDHGMYDAQVATLAGRWRCIAWDWPGHGRSGPARGTSVSPDTLAEQAAGLIEALGIGPVHFVGCSLGAFVGIRLAARRPDLVRSLVLISATASAHPASWRRPWSALAWAARLGAMGIAAGRVEATFFGPSFRGDRARASERAAWRRRIASVGRSANALIDGTVNRAEVTDLLGEIRCPTLIVYGEEDRVVSPKEAVKLQEGIEGARRVAIPASGHLPTIEQPASVDAALRAFLERNAQDRESESTAE